MRKVIHTNSEGGDSVALVSLGPEGRKGYATVDEADLELLVSLGLSLKWNRSPQGMIKAPASNASGNSVSVARVLMDAGIGQSVSFRDGDTTNLSRSNLELSQQGQGTRRDRDFLTPASERRAYGPEPIHVYIINNKEVSKEQFEYEYNY